MCHNLNLGLATKVRGLQGCEPKGSLGVTLHALGSVRECEQVNLLIHKGVSTLGVGVSVDSRIFKR
jgi:hypothetical protein